jgi:hypothetical protein
MQEPASARLSYRGKHFTVPALSQQGFVVEPDAAENIAPIPADSPIVKALNTTFDLPEFRTPRRPVSLGLLDEAERLSFSQPGVPRTLDMPIKFPGSAFRVPRDFAQFLPVIQRVADFEAAVNAACYDEYYCYLTVDQGQVPKGVLQREAPCHVDGFQGARFRPKVRCNHTYVVSDSVPTVYYVQPFAVDHLDEERHNFFWEFNRQVAQTKSAHAFRPMAYEVNLMDCYTVHRGDAAPHDLMRTWLRLSFEVRIFDRLGNAHNPLFRYDWQMVPRDIEGLNLVAYDPDSDPTLRVFPWQQPDGQPYKDPRARTQPNLTPSTPDDQ